MWSLISDLDPTLDSDSDPFLDPDIDPLDPDAALDGALDPGKDQDPELDLFISSTGLMQCPHSFKDPALDPYKNPDPAGPVSRSGSSF